MVLLAVPALMYAACQLKILVMFGNSLEKKHCMCHIYGNSIHPCTNKYTLYTCSLRHTTSTPKWQKRECRQTDFRRLAFLLYSSHLFLKNMKIADAERLEGK